MPDPDSVTAIIPTRDRWPLLLRAVDSVLRQEHEVLEILVVDDGSAVAAPEDWRLADPRVRLLRNARSLGVSGARNRALAEARGAWVGFLDDDDLWAPAKLTTQLRAVAARPKAGLVYGAALNVSSRLEPQGLYPPAGGPNPLARMLERNHVPAGASNVLAPTALIRTLGGFDESFAQLADWDLWTRVLEVSEAVEAPDTLVAYVQHEQAMSATDWRPLLREYGRLRAKHAALAQRLGVSVSAAPFMSWAVGRQRLGSRSAAARCSLEGGLRYREPLSLARGVGLLVLPGPATAAIARRRGRAPGGQPAAAPGWLASYR